MWATLRQHTIVMGLLIVIGGICGFGASQLLTPVYTSSATIFVTVGGARSSADVSQTGAYLTSRMKSYSTLATSAAVLKDALAGLQSTETFQRLLTPSSPVSQTDELTTAATHLQDLVTVANEADTTVLSVSVKGPSPKDAQRLTDAVSGALATQIEQTEEGADQFSPIRATVINNANLPLSPSSPKPYLNAVLGAALGFVLGAALSVYLSTRAARPARAQATARRRTRTGLFSAKPATTPHGSLRGPQ
jgi:succinoglycan biosynthesis transport protein ExoP